MTEPGEKALSVYCRQVKDWKEFLGYVDLLESEERRFVPVVVDVVDRLFDMAEVHACKRLGIDHPSEGEWGRGWGEVSTEFSRGIARFLRVCPGAVFLSHVEERTIRSRNGTESHRAQASIPDRARRIVEPLVDVICYYHYANDGSRVLGLAGDADITAGHRLNTHFQSLPEDGLIPMGDSAAEAQRRLLDAFNNIPIEKVSNTRGKRTRRRRRSGRSVPT